MRQYVLTQQERQIIEKYLATGEKLEGFTMLLSRCKHMQTIKQDLELIDQLLAKVGAAPQ